MYTDRFQTQIQDFNCSSKIKTVFTKTDNLIATIKGITIKNKTNEKEFFKVGRIPDVIPTRWSSWLKAVLFQEIIADLVKKTNAEKGCITYNVHQDKKEKTKFAMIEQWECQADLDAHLKTDHVKKLGQDAEKLGVLVGKPKASFFTAAIVKLDKK